MLKRFSELVVVNRTDGLLADRIPLVIGAKSENSPTHTEAGIPIIYVEEPEGDERHIALGKFMDAWSDLEAIIGTILADAVGTPRVNIAVLMNALGTRGQMDVISVLGRVGAGEADADRLTDLLARLKTNNTRRNHIVHGRWMLELRLYNANGRVLPRLEQKRLYDVSDPELRSALRKVENRKERNRYLFSIRRIEALTCELERLKSDFSSYYCSRKGLPEGTKQYLIEGLAHGRE